MRFLVVDDSSTMRRIIINTLNKLGYQEIVEASNGREGIDKLAAADVDMVITDWNMPEMNGIDFIRALRGLDKTKDTPILMVTMPRGDVQMMRAGMTQRLTNADPAPLEIIAITIKPSRRPAEPATPASPPPGITRTTVLETHDVRVVRATFARNGREPVHTHPNDLLTIQITAGRVEIFDGSDTAIRSQSAGTVHFLPRNVPHAYASADSKPFEILSIAIK